jgi:hypothetical protein
MNPDWQLIVACGAVLFAGTFLARRSWNWFRGQASHGCGSCAVQSATKPSRVTVPLEIPGSGTEER